MSFASSEFAWNSVDIRGDDGLLHNGRVIDVVDGGLVVHFGGTGLSGPQLVPFGNVYHRQYSDYLQRERRNEEQKSLEEERTVEVLLRLQPENPWKWYPGVLLDTFGLVSVTLPDRELKGFVVEQRIRERSSKNGLRWLLVRKERFLRRQVLVPSGNSVVIPPDDQLMAIFNGYCRNGHYWMMGTQVNNTHHGVFKELAVLGIFDGGDEDDEFEEDGFDWPQHHGIGAKYYKREPLDKLLLSLLHADAITPESTNLLFPATPSSDGDIQSLYRDPTIFPQIFECLTTVQQTKRRGVCRIWDTILTSACIRRVLTVSQPRYSRDYTNRVYRFAACLYHCWTKYTRILVFYGGKNPGTCDGIRLAATARLLQRILAEKGIPVVEVLLLTGEWHFRFNARNWVSALWETFASLSDVCQQVVFKYVGFNVVSDRYDRSFMIVRSSNQRITRQLTEGDFWTMLNNGARDLDTEEVERLAEWISHAAALRVPRAANYSGIPSAAHIVNITQTVDPRDGVHYRGISFVEDAALERVDARHLTKLALHALLQFFERGGRRIFFYLR